jgi:hypothetical protein
MHVAKQGVGAPVLIVEPLRKSLKFAGNAKHTQDEPNDDDTQSQCCPSSAADRLSNRTIYPRMEEEIQRDLSATEARDLSVTEARDLSVTEARAI